jgi:ATP-binding cassette, subfamily C (CFTR/MRP), member 1
MTSLPQMSTGQIQLFALARAILQKEALNSTVHLSESKPNHGGFMPILLLDEATSSLDQKTESLVRSIIHQEFIEKGHTIISITHRLSGVTESTRPGQDMLAFFSKGKLERICEVEDIARLA